MRTLMGVVMSTSVLLTAGVLAIAPATASPESREVSWMCASARATLVAAHARGSAVLISRAEARVAQYCKGLGLTAEECSRAVSAPRPTLMIGCGTAFGTTTISGVTYQIVSVTSSDPAVAVASSTPTVVPSPDGPLTVIAITSIARGTVTLCSTWTSGTSSCRTYTVIAPGDPIPG